MSIEQFVQTATQNLGTTEETTRSATGGLLRFMQENSDKSEFSQLAEKLPGAADLLKMAPPAPGETKVGGGLLGGIMGKAAGKLGGGAGAAASVMALLKQSGMESNQAGQFVSMFLSFAREKAGNELVGKILGRVPALKNLGD